MWPILWSPRSLMALRPCKALPARRNLFPMLPGFRFLFAAILLSTSVLVFGLGAAAVLRAAHEQFAESGSWRPAPDTSAAQQGEMAMPVLAMLRVDQPTAPKHDAAKPDATKADATKPDAAPVTPAAQPTEIAPSPEPVKAAAPDAPEAAKPDAPEVAKPEIAEPEVVKAELAPEQPKAEDKETQAPLVAAAPPSPAREDTPAALSDAAVAPPA